MNQQYIKIIENGKSAIYTWQKETDSLGDHIVYNGPRGSFFTTYLGFNEIIRDCIRKGFEIVESNFDNINEMIEEAEKVIEHEKEIHERWKREHGESCVLI